MDEFLLNLVYGCHRGRNQLCHFFVDRFRGIDFVGEGGGWNLRIPIGIEGNTVYYYYSTLLEFLSLLLICKLQNSAVFSLQQYHSISVLTQLEDLLDLRRSSMMCPPGLEVCLWPHVTLNFDLMHAKSNVSCPGPVDHLCQFVPKLYSLVFKTSLITDERTNHRSIIRQRGWKQCVCVRLPSGTGLITPTYKTQLAVNSLCFVVEILDEFVEQADL